jgi:hypothetical protein
MVQPSEAATGCEVTRPGGRVRMTGSGHEAESGERRETNEASIADLTAQTLM